MSYLRNDDRAMNIGYLVTCEGYTEAAAIAETDANATLIALLTRFQRQTCATKGHRLVDESHGGPESGSMGVRCTRCDWSHSVALY